MEPIADLLDIQCGVVSRARGWTGDLLPCSATCVAIQPIREGSRTPAA